MVVATPDHGGCGGEEEWPSGGAEGAAGSVLGRCPVGVGRAGGRGGCGGRPGEGVDLAGENFHEASTGDLPEVAVDAMAEERMVIHDTLPVITLPRR